MSKFVAMSSGSWRKYIIDLTNLIKVDSIMLFFENNNQKKHIYVKIFKAISEKEK